MHCTEAAYNAGLQINTHPRGSVNADVRLAPDLRSIFLPFAHYRDRYSYVFANFTNSSNVGAAM